MHVLVAPDKFAGTLTAAEAARAMRAGWLRRRPDDTVAVAPISDGGPGFVDAHVHLVLAGRSLAQLDLSGVTSRTEFERAIADLPASGQKQIPMAEVPQRFHELPRDAEIVTLTAERDELRDRLLRVVLVVVVIFLGLTPFANWLFSRLAGPLTKHLPEGSSMIAIEVASPFFTPFKLAMVIAIFAAMPYILYQAWAFIAPGLYRHERKRVFPLLVSSTLLFYLGAAFAYFVVFPLVFGFLTKTAPEGVAVMTDISRYLDFVLTLFFAFGIAFEVPVATVLLVWTGAVSFRNWSVGRLGPACFLAVIS